MVKSALERVSPLLALSLEFNENALFSLFTYRSQEICGSSKELFAMQLLQIYGTNERR
jgi:hypothetical protein